MLATSRSTETLTRPRIQRLSLFALSTWILVPKYYDLSVVSMIEPWTMLTNDSSSFFRATGARSGSKKISKMSKIKPECDDSNNLNKNEILFLIFFYTKIFYILLVSYSHRFLQSKEVH